MTKTERTLRSKAWFDNAARPDQTAVDGRCQTVDGDSVEENYRDSRSRNLEVIRNFDDPLRTEAGFAEVVNMRPPDSLVKQGITCLPTLGAVLMTQGSYHKVNARHGISRHNQ